MPVPVNLPPLKGIEQSSPLAAWARLVPQLVSRLGEARSYEVLSPLAGFTHTIPVATGVCVLTPLGPILGGTITLPAQASDGFQQEIVSSAVVANLTIAPNTGQTVLGPTFFSLQVGVKVSFFFMASSSTWLRML